MACEGCRKRREALKKASVRIKDGMITFLGDAMNKFEDVGKSGGSGVDSKINPDNPKLKARLKRIEAKRKGQQPVKEK